MTPIRWSAIIFAVGGTLANMLHLESLMFASRSNPFSNAGASYFAGWSSFVMYETIIIVVALLAFVFGKRRVKSNG